MFQNNKLLAVIPARGGSKGVFRKNLRALGGVPLIAHTINAAKGSRYIDSTIVSTDDLEIKAVAEQLGCRVPFIRPAVLASDTASNLAAVLHAVSLCNGYDYVILLQPTSPLRRSEDIDNCVELLFSSGAKSSVSLTEAPKSPYWMYTLTGENRMEPVLSDGPAGERQALPKAYVLNGAIYIAKISWLLAEEKFVSDDTVAFVMPLERSIDIDTEFDLKVANFYLEEISKYD